MREYWDTNPGTASAMTVWDAFKAYTRGRYQTIIARVRRERRADLSDAERKADLQEAQFLRTKDPGDYDTLQLLTREVVRIRTSLTRKSLLAQTQRIFEQGERSGKLLAWLSREQQGGMCIPHIQGPDGCLTYDSDEINDSFASFYRNLYGSKVTYTRDELTDYLEPIDFPVLTVKYRDNLDAPITTDELLKALKSLQSGKSPGPDGIPVEFYKQYAEELTGKLQAMLTEAQQLETLPYSLSEAVIVVIPKPGKDSSLCSSYRPISLINVDAKLLAKVLAMRLNTVITALIHPDQTGFMPGRGTDINIRRLFTHMDRAQAESAGVVVFL